MKQLPFEDFVISIADTINLITIMNFNFEWIEDRQTKRKENVNVNVLTKTPNLCLTIINTIKNDYKH
jgi:hypothetical protein